MARSLFPHRGAPPRTPVITVAYDTPREPLPSLLDHRPTLAPATPRPAMSAPTGAVGPTDHGLDARPLVPAGARRSAGPDPVPPSTVEGEPGALTGTRASALPLSLVLTGVSEAIADAWPIPVWIEAEVAKWRPHGSGHIYLELVERAVTGQELAKANARIWSSNASRLVHKFEASTGERLRDGIRSQWRVKPEFSPRFGFGLTIDDIRAVWTPGAHERKKEAIRDALRAEGLWERQQAWPQPTVIARIAVVAPFDAAGWGDFSSEAQRWEHAGLVRTHRRTATFEGDKTSSSVCAAISAFAQEQRAALAVHGQPAFDVLIVLRGGGAKTALAWMDDEAIARAIATFPGPVWSAIGHEQDHGLLDEVAAWSAHTPSKAAQKIWETLVHETAQGQRWWDELTTALRHRPAQLEQTIDHRWAMLRQEAGQRQAQAAQTVDHWWGTVQHEATGRLDRLGAHLDDLVREVVGLGPAATLARGYAVVLDDQGRLVRSASRTSSGPWTVRWSDGERRVTPDPDASASVQDDPPPAP